MLDKATPSLYIMRVQVPVRYEIGAGLGPALFLYTVQYQPTAQDTKNNGKIAIAKNKIFFIKSFFN